ncbi:unnamed protein product, partial [Prorocentrum cordatum]
SRRRKKQVQVVQLSRFRDEMLAARFMSEQLVARCQSATTKGEIENDKNHLDRNCAKSMGAAKRPAAAESAKVEDKKSTQSKSKKPKLQK